MVSNKMLIVVDSSLIFLHEKDFLVYNTDKDYKELKSEYQNIWDKLDKLEQEGTLVHLIDRPL